jgi:hypothetical protein
MISRNPNSRASSENAPGPRRTTANATAARKATDSVDAHKLGLAAGPIEIHMAASTLTSTPAIGVKKPINSEIPLATASEPPTNVPAVASGRSLSSIPPWTIATPPIAALSSSRASPARPRGNA